MIYINLIQFIQTLDLTYIIKKLSDYWEWILAFYYEVIQILIINIKVKTSVFLQKNGIK